MKINETAHLCYSLNVFPRSDSGYIQNIDVIAERFCEIRKNLGYPEETPFALGLWLDSESVEELDEPAKLAELKSILNKYNFYVFTVNAFPYGKFHDGPIKDNVYLPNWTDDRRKEFTIKVADILSELLPESVTGSISTLPGGYREHLQYFTRPSSAAGGPISNNKYPISNYEEEIAANLIKTADHLSEIEQKTGKKILLGIEMEPDCIWESPTEFCEFRKKYLISDNAEKYIGVCYDTCHQELLEGSPGSGIKYLIDEKIPIAKIQLSAALKADLQNTPELVTGQLANFADPVYLHQTRFFDKGRKILTSCCDIDKTENKDASRIVTHFHMPLYASEVSGNFEVCKEELKSVLSIFKENPEICSNLEIETYTYNVLPEKIKPETTEHMILDEYTWVLKQIQ